jgi:hypothetical protein
MSEEVSYTHTTINDPNGSGNHVTALLIVSGIIALPVVFIASIYLIVTWLV